MKDYVDLTPDGGRMVLFWSNKLPHEVLYIYLEASGETLKDDSSCDRKDRYALTMWIPTDNFHTIHNPQSKLTNLGDEVFPTRHA